MSPKRQGRGRGGSGWKGRIKPLPKFRANQKMLLDLIFGMPPSRTPLITPTAIWALHVADMYTIDPGRCVDACLALRAAFEVFGIPSRPAAVRVGIGAVGEDPARLLERLHGAERAHFNADGTFNGHLVLVVPHPGVFLDPTIQQFPEVPRTAMAELPAIGRLPGPGGLGMTLVLSRRQDNDCLYVPGDIENTIYGRPEVAGKMPEIRHTGLFLASNAFDILRQPGLLEKTRKAPYPRLQRQLDLLAEAEAIVRPDGYNFRDPRTGAEIRLSDIA